MSSTTKPGRRPSDYKPKASVISAQQKAAQIAAQEAERVRSDEALSVIPVDEKALRKEQLIASGLGSKKVAAKLTFLSVLFIGLIVGSIGMFFNNLTIPAVITLAIAAIALIGLSLWVKSLYAALVKELGKEETIDVLLSMAKNRNTAKKPHDDHVQLS